MQHGASRPQDSKAKDGQPGNMSSPQTLLCIGVCFQPQLSWLSIRYIDWFEGPALHLERDVNKS
jgi:hypothetical protein